MLKSFEKKSLGKLPIMVGSKYCNTNNIPPDAKHEIDECKFDVGGYFIVKGKEKVLISQEKLKEREMHLFMDT